MALVTCPECGRERVSDSAESCPDCGYPIKNHFSKLSIPVTSENISQKQEKEAVEVVDAYELTTDVKNEVSWKQRAKERTEKRERQNKRITVCIVASVVILCIFIITIVKKNSGKFSNKSKEEQPVNVDTSNKKQSSEDNKNHKLETENEMHDIGNDIQGTWIYEDSDIKSVLIFDEKNYEYTLVDPYNEWGSTGTYIIDEEKKRISYDSPKYQGYGDDIPRATSYSYNGGTLKLLSGGRSYNKEVRNAFETSVANVKEALSKFEILYNLNSAGGIVLDYYIKNESDKDIKYVRFDVELYNAVGDPVTDDITGEYSEKVELIGPVEANGGQLFDEYPDELIIGYCDNLARIVIHDVTVVFMDGTQGSVDMGWSYNGK